MRNARVFVCYLTRFIGILLFLSSCERSRTPAFQEYGASFRTPTHAIECRILFDRGEVTKSLKDATVIGGLLVNYVVGEPNEPKFIWSDIIQELRAKSRRGPSGRSFTLYVNDAQGNLKKLILPQELGQKAFPPSSQCTQESLTAFWNKHVEPNLAEPKMPEE